MNEWIIKGKTTKKTSTTYLCLVRLEAWFLEDVFSESESDWTPSPLELGEEPGLRARLFFFLLSGGWATKVT